jgi:anti-sigma B factor antagonist
VTSSDDPEGNAPVRPSIDVLRLDDTIALLIPGPGLDGDQLDSVLRAKIENLIEEGVTGLVVDMRSFAMLDSSGLGALIACRGDIAEANGVRLVLTGVGPSLHRTLSRAMLLSVLPVYETVERAFAALRA